VVLISLSRDPALNLAFEERLFRTPPKTLHLLLYVNRPCVVIGRNQNPEWETDPDLLAQKRIPLIRRFTGGGAVWHDPGNLVWSFIGPKENFSIDSNFTVILSALRSLGFDPILRERRDILIDGKKISGCAYAHTKTASIHHGTLLIRSDLRKLKEYLRPAKPQHNTTKKYVKSVRSETANLSEFRNLSLWKAGLSLIRCFWKESGPSPLRFVLPVLGLRNRL
jgi:lipoate-protein ligase A